MIIDNKILGFIAGTLTAFAFLPQVIKVYKSKETKGLYMTTLIIYFIGQTLWILHGYYQNDDAIVLFAFITAMLYIFLIYAKINF